MGACRAGLLGVPAIRSRGAALSSAILYLAIVAIWAVVLVPRWLRLRSAPARQTTTELFEDAADAEATEEATEAAGTELTNASGTRRAPIEWEDLPPPSYELFDTVDSGPAGPVADGRAGEGPAGRAGEGPAGRAGEGSVAGRAGGAAADEHEEPVPEPAPASRAAPVLTAAERRARVLRARRRMLVTVVSIAVAATVLAVMHLAPFWVVIPPVLMLAGFFVLLREAARSDALRARHQMSARTRSSAVAGHEEDTPAEAPAAPAASAAAASTAAGPRSGGHGEASGQFGETGAQVIDISQRLGDQLYDQYTDAAERAVGD
jgi:hypothetical protein